MTFSHFHPFFAPPSQLLMPQTVDGAGSIPMRWSWWSRVSSRVHLLWWCTTTLSSHCTSEIWLNCCSVPASLSWCKSQCQYNMQLSNYSKVDTWFPFDVFSDLPPSYLALSNVPTVSRIFFSQGRACPSPVAGEVKNHQSMLLRATTLWDSVRTSCHKNRSVYIDHESLKSSKRFRPAILSPFCKRDAWGLSIRISRDASRNPRRSSRKSTCVSACWQQSWSLAKIADRIHCFVESHLTPRSVNMRMRCDCHRIAGAAALD